MKRSSLVACIAGLLCCTLAVGCGRSPTSSALSATGTNGGSSSPSDVAFEAANFDLQTADSLRHGPCGSFGLPLPIPAGCPYDAATAGFTCGPDISDDGLIRIRSYQFLDASAVPQSAYDALTTASIRFESRIAGTITRHGVTSVVDDRRDLIESGLEGSETTRTWNGTGSSSHQDSSSSGAFSINSSTTVSNVIVPSPWARDSWPLSGTITTRVATSRGTDVTSVITFNGTRYVPMTIGGNTITIDLARMRHGRPGGPIARGGHGGPGGPGGPGGRPGGGGRGRH